MPSPSMVVVACDCCGKPFSTLSRYRKAGRGRFCSRGCFAEYRTRKVERACAHCERIFSTHPYRSKTGRGLYCSKSCYHAGRTGKSLRPGAVEVICAECGVTLKAEPSEIARGRRYCSHACKHAEARRRNTGKSPQSIRGSAYKHWRDAVLLRDNHTCRACGSTTKIEAHHLKGWSLFPHLRYDPDNGIALCNRCHRRIHSNH
jgi:5-methylcytosine-specific restriction endonuclease McrA